MPPVSGPTCPILMTSAGASAAFAGAAALGAGASSFLPQAASATAAAIASGATLNIVLFMDLFS